MVSINDIFTTDTLGIYVGNNNIKILYGSKNKIKQFSTIKTPENSVEDDKILNLQAVAKTIKNYIEENKISSKCVSFAIQGQDIIIRHIETPIIPEKNVRESVEWEINQYLPNEGNDHYIDFEIVDKISNNEKKVFKIMVAAVLRDKIDIYVKLSQMLNLELKSIDLSANCTARLFKNVVKKDKTIKSIGVINIGSKSSSIVILENGKLFMEKEVPFGIFNVQREVIKRKELNSEVAIDYIFSDLNLQLIDENDEIERRIQTLFDNLFSSFIKIIQFYTTGKASKNLDKIYVIGDGTNINGLDKYVKDYFDTDTLIPDSLKSLNFSTKVPEGFELKYYGNIVGLLFRKE